MLVVQINTLIHQVNLYLITFFEVAIAYHVVKFTLCSLLKLLCKKNSDASLSVEERSKRSKTPCYFVGLLKTL